MRRNNIKMLIFAERLWPQGSGAQLALKFLIDNLKKYIDITIITLSHLSYYEKIKYYHGIKIIKIPQVKVPGKFFSLTSSILHSRKLIENLVRNTDIIYIADTWVFPAFLAKRLNKPVIKMFHSLANVNYFTAPTANTEYNNIIDLVKAVLRNNLFYRKHFHKQIIEPLYAITSDIFSWNIVTKCIDINITPSNALKNKLKSLLPGLKIIHIPNIIPNEPYIPLDKNPDKTFIYVGGKDYQKGFFDLEKAIVFLGKKAILQTGICYRYRVFELVSTLKHAERKQILLSNNLKVILRAKLQRRELMKLYQRVHVAIIPSKCFEAFPYAAIEAQLWGRPVIASKIGGIPEIIEDRKTGILVEPGNPRKLAEAIEIFCNMSESIITDIGLRAREHILKKFNNREIIKKTLRIIFSLI